MIGVVVAGLFGLVGMHVVLAQEQFRLDRLEAKATSEQTTYDQLRLEVAELESPQRVVADAQKRLGMVQPPAISYLAPTVTDNSQPASKVQGEAALQREAALQGETAWSVVKRQLAGHP
jgi:cell division protein FtsL